MKKCLGVLILSIICFFNCKALAKDKVTISYFHAQPHIMFDPSNKKPYGALYSFLNEHIAPQMGVQFVWDSHPSNIPRQLIMLSNEIRDAVALLLFSPTRAEKFSYPQNPFYAPKSTIGIPSRSRLNKIEKVEDILSLKIGYVDKTYLSPFMRDKRIQFDFISSSITPNEANLKKLQAGRIDAIYIPDKAALLCGIKNLNIEDQIRVIDLPEKPGKAHVVFSKNNKALAEAFDKAYQEIDGNRVYMELLNKYLDVNQL